MMSKTEHEQERNMRNMRSFLVTAGRSVACLLVFGLAGTSVRADEPMVRLQPLDLSQVSTLQSEPLENRRDYSPLPYDAEELEAAKAAAEAGMDGLMPETPLQPPAKPPAPTLVKGFAGQTFPNATPPDTTGAVGNTRYIEPLNVVYKIWDKSGKVKGKGTLNQLIGADPSWNVFDPQVMWDATTMRFYVTSDAIINDNNNLIVYSFSKTASPNNHDDFCHYFWNYGAFFPDYPKLGDTRHGVLIGVNTFTSTFVGSDLIYISKPPNGKITECPQQDTLFAGAWYDLQTASGDVAFTPVPANQIDTSAVGYVVGRPASIPAAGATELELWKVTSTADGAELVDIKGKKVPVAAYKVPPNAPQPGAGAPKLDTSDTRNTQAVSAINPGRGGKLSLWTQHTVLAGVAPDFRSEVRWYEINPAANSLFAMGKLTNKNVFYFNGAISPDRAVKGKTKKFGDAMVLQASASSSAVFPSIRAVSKIGNAKQSRVRIVKKGTEILDDFACGEGDCRWGDYAGLTPDPIAVSGAAHGRVWGNNELGGGPKNPPGNPISWKTWNFILTP
jgi:hypothetical protein